MRALKRIAFALAGFCVLLAGAATADPLPLDALLARGAQVSRDRATGLVSFIGTAAADARLAPPPGAPDAVSNARAHLDGFAAHFGIANPRQDLAPGRVHANERGTAVRFQQLVSGVPVIAGDLVVSTDAAGALRAIAGKATDQVVDTTPKNSAGKAALQAVALVAKRYGLPEARLKASAPVLSIYDSRLLAPDKNPARLVWRTEVSAPGRPDVSEFVLVSAEDGAIVLSFSKVHKARNRITYDAASTSAIPGTLECTEGTDPCTNGAIPDADNAHHLAADVYAFYNSRFGRDGIEGLGNPIVSTVRYCPDPAYCPYANAFYSFDIHQMVYGAGLVVDDVAAHEFTHGVTAVESALFYFAEPGAINESLSDIFGEFVDLTNGTGTDTPAVRWLMGEDSSLGVIRDMKNPPNYSQPDRKLSPNWYTGPFDQGGVHTNSGVGNKAAYLIVDGDTFNGHTVQGIGIDKAAQIYYEAQTALLTSGSNYMDLYNALFQACVNLTGYYGITSGDCTQVREATLAVQMNLAAPAISAASFCPAGGQYSYLGYDDFEGGVGVGSLTRIGVGTYWFLDSVRRSGGVYSAVGADEPFVTDSSMTYQLASTVATGDRLYFEHAFDTEFLFDGGVVEYSANGGPFVDAGTLLVAGQGYNATISTLFASPIAGRRAFTGFSGGFLWSLYDLNPLAGKSVRWRFRSTSDNAVSAYGWNVDNIFHVHCSTGGMELTQTSDSVVESSGTVVVTVNRTGGAAGPATVTYTTTDGSSILGKAIAGVDYTARTGTLAWAAGDAHPKTISIPIINRPGTQGVRTFHLVLNSATGGTLGPATVETIAIFDSDGTVQFDSSGVTVGESGPNGVLTVTRTGFPGTAASVTWATGAPQTATPGADYTTKTGTLTWIAGDASPKTIAVGPNAVAGNYIPIINDALVEGPETFTVTLSAPTGALQLGAQKTATVTIVSDDMGLTMAAPTASASESAPYVQLQVLRSGPTAGTASVSYATVNGTAVAGTHYVGTAGILSWGIGDSTPQLITVPLIDNAAVNANRTFSVVLSSPVGATIGTPASTAVTIADDDNTLQFTLANASVTEGVANLMLSVSRIGGTAGSASVGWSTADGSALAGSDFGVAGVAAPVSGTLNWAAGDGAPKSVAIPILNDTVVEGVKNFSVSLSGPSGATLGAITTVNVSLSDNDAGVRFAQASYEVTEGTPSIVLTVQRIGPAAAAATATWATVNGTAESGKDFGLANSFAPRTGMVSWLAGDAAAKTIVIPIINDTVGGEGDETFQVSLIPGAGLVLGTPGVATVTIHDNDIPPQTNVQFTSAKYVVLENVGNVELVVHRSDLGPGFGLAASVNYATVPGTAMATSDYLTRTGTLNWAANDNGDKTILVPIVNNTVAESTESFKVVLSNPSAGLGFGTPNEATVTILDDDETFPLDGAMPDGFSTPLGATRGWHVSNDAGAFEGVYSLKSDEIDDNQTAELEMNGTFGAGNVTFRVKVSSEPDFDFLRFYVDGELRQSWSGVSVTTWQAATPISLPAGPHILRWAYQKDGGVSVGLDAAYIDGLVTPAFIPAP